MFQVKLFVIVQVFSNFEVISSRSLQVVVIVVVLVVVCRMLRLVVESLGRVEEVEEQENKYKEEEVEVAGFGNSLWGGG